MGISANSSNWASTSVVVEEKNNLIIKTTAAFARIADHEKRPPTPTGIPANFTHATTHHKLRKHSSRAVITENQIKQLHQEFPAPTPTISPSQEPMTGIKSDNQSPSVVVSEQQENASDVLKESAIPSSNFLGSSGEKSSEVVPFNNKVMPYSALHVDTSADEVVPKKSFFCCF